MSLRVLFAGPALAVAMLLPTPGFAGGYGCPTCFTPVVSPPYVTPGHGWGPTVGTVTRFVRARWATVSTPVAVPPHREWRLIRGPHGRLVGCWVNVPGRVVLRRAPMLVRPSAMIETRYGADFGTRTQTFTAHSGSVDWVPTATTVAAY